MARRDNQGIQIAMIVFILTTLLFMVGTYLGYSSWAAATGELEQTKTKLTQSDGQMQAAVRAAGGLKTSIGLDPSLGDDAAETEAKRYVEEVMGQGLAEESRNFLGIVRARDTRIANLAQQLADANQQIQQLRGDVARKEENARKMIALAEKAAAEAVEDLKKQTDKFQNDVAVYLAENQKLSDERGKMKSTADKAVADAQKAIALAEKNQNDSRRRAKTLQEELNVIKNDTPDQYDGRIIGVVAATKSVLVDIGRADGVRAKTRFSVYDAEDTNVRTAKKKASIEITRVISDHRSEARIVSAGYAKPIFADDFIYSPIWSPGTRLGIALVGELDVDQDGRDDREYIKNLIQLNGGRVDAEVVDGKLVGGMTVNTRYIVVGEGELSGAAATMLQDANLLTIERMSLNELMDLMGTGGRARSVQFGTGIPRPGDFAPQPRGDVLRSSNGFRKRTPTPRRLRPRNPAP